MKRWLAMLALVAATSVQAGTTLGFTGDFGIFNWATSFTSPCTGCLTSHNSSSLTLLGADGNVGSNDQFTDRYITFLTAGTVSFDWSYRTADDPAFDPFGVITDNGSGLLFTQISDDFGGSPQSGTRSFFVGAGEVFGFRVWSIAGNVDFGAATAVISNFSVDDGRVPEPATLALVGLGLLGAAAARRRAKA